MASSTSRFLFSNGVVSPPAATPPVATFLETHPGAYTTSRTHNDASFVLFWDRHLKRLADSVTILYNSNPQLLFGPQKPSMSPPPPPLTADPGAIESKVRELVNGSVAQVLPIALKERRDGEELVITTLVSGNPGKLSEIDGVFDVSIHIGSFVPTAFGAGGNGAHLAVVGRGRDVAAAKYADWVRIRKPLQRLRPPSVTDLLLSNDGDRILEGTVCNFFVVRRKDNSEENGQNMQSFEVQTAPIREGVLPGIIRQLVMEVCLSKGISFREVAPSWSESELWAEAFITSSVKLLQHVETISVPSSLESLSNSWNEVSWEDKHFEDGAGMITTIIQKEIMEKAVSDGYSCSYFM